MTTLRQSRRAAFTLVEIMVAVAILAMIVAAIYSTWTAILKSSKVGLEAAAAAQRERMAMRVLEDALASTRLYTANWQWYWFSAKNGSEAELSFVSHLPRAFPRGGKFGDHYVRRVSFAVENGSGSERELVMRQAPLLMDMDQDEKEHPLVLARNVKRLSFDFWEPRKGEWLDEWKDTNQVPRMVRVTLSLGHPSTYSYSWMPQMKDEEITRVVSIAALGVPPQWQAMTMPPIMPGMGGTNLPGGIPPGFPGALPPGMQPGLPGNPGARNF